MSRLRVLFLSAGVALVSAMAFGASAAQAANNWSCYSHWFGGIAIPGVQSISTDLQDGNLFDTDSGTVHFDGNATYLKVDTDIGEAANSGVYRIELVSDGEYSNRVCGGLSTWDDAAPSNTTLTPTGKLVADPLPFFSTDPAVVAESQGPPQMTYHIDLTAEHAVMDVTGGSDGQYASGGDGAGYLNVRLLDSDDNSETQPCVDEDLVLFLYEGVFALRIGPLP